MVNYVRAERIMMKAHADLSEKWVQQKIADDPAILGLGNLLLRAQERIQPRAGRLDLLLQDPDTSRRYEVELQLGPTDESHIIRTIEYWDIERKRYPQYDHCAVIIAEDITSRFLNVISLFNGTIPLIAIQLQAIRVGEDVTLVFTKVIDELVRGVVDEEEEEAAAPADRNHWINNGSADTVKMMDQIFELVQEVAPTVQLKYNASYIGLSQDGHPNNFVSFKPKKNHLIFEFKLPRSEDIDGILEKAGLETRTYNTRFGVYGARLMRGDVERNLDTLKLLVKMAFDYRTS